MFDVAQKQDRAFELALRVMEGRYGDADRGFSPPAGDKIALAARALLAWRVGFLNQIDEPRLPFKDLFQGLSCRYGG